MRPGRLGRRGLAGARGSRAAPRRSSRRGRGRARARPRACGALANPARSRARRAAAALRRPARPSAARLRPAGYVPRVVPEAVSVVGAGLAGCEAAWQLARRGVPVRLFEMRPARRSPAHSSDALAELVCSNSLRSDARENAVGLLHEELRRAGSLVLAAADATRVPAGSALAVDRGAFSAWIAERIEAEPAIELVRREVDVLPEGLSILATGPLTSDALAAEVQKLCGDSLYFYDSIAPVVHADSLDLDVIFRASRW
ncbi:MAG: FAD-dependent oxidoreductase, partial [Deltaproteobacteria bacterium]|nr:FAD-dependent oxidoreductase [Deltaproteobacteria bacterium]